MNLRSITDRLDWRAFVASWGMFFSVMAAASAIAGLLFAVGALWFQFVHARFGSSWVGGFVFTGLCALTVHVPISLLALFGKRPEAK
jgi:hypothetical protein